MAITDRLDDTRDYVEVLDLKGYSGTLLRLKIQIMSLYRLQLSCKILLVNISA